MIQIYILSSILCQFSLLVLLFLNKVSSRTCKLRGKECVQLTLNDAYIHYMSQIDVFQVVLC